MKAMKWSKDHRDIYVFSKEHQVWVKAKCELETHMECTAPATLPVGTKFSYNVNETDSLAYAAELSLAHYNAMQGEAR